MGSLGVDARKAYKLQLLHVQLYLKKNDRNKRQLAHFEMRKILGVSHFRRGLKKC